MQCAHNVIDQSITCYTLLSLKKIAQNYNKIHKEKINISLSKKELYKILLEKTKCKNDLCLKKYGKNDKEIQEYTLKPQVSKGKLTNEDLEKTMNQFQKRYKHVLFLGVGPSDVYSKRIANLYLKFDLESIKNIDKDMILILNTDRYGHEGIHWVSLYIMKDRIEYFDSLGNNPNEDIKKIVKMFGSKKLIVNKKRFQKNDDNCGVYILYFLINRLQNIPFQKIIDEDIKDINKYRSVYFYKD